MKRAASILAIVTLAAACSRPPATIPEITTHMQDRPWLETPDTKEPAGIAVSGGHILLVRRSGAILKLDPRSGERVLAAQVPGELRPGIICRADRLLLRTRNDPGEWVLFDPEKLQEVDRLKPRPGATRAVALGRRILVTQGKDQVFIQGFAGLPVESAIPLADKDFRSCRVVNDSVWILTRTRLVQLSPPAYKAREIPLPRNAASGLLIVKGKMYYGSEDRFLVKWSPPSPRPEWTARLPRVLKLSPLAVGGYIAALPEDQYVHFFTPRGGREWWAPLDGTRLFPPLQMNRHIAVFLYPAETPVIRFFDWRSRSVSTLQIKGTPVGEPVAVAGRVFFLAEAGKEFRINVVTNRRGVDLKIKPQFPRVTGKSLEFTMEAINLIRPQFVLRLSRRGEKKPVLEQTFKDREKPSLAWFAREPGEYVLEVEARSADGFTASGTERFRVHDLAKLTRERAAAVQAACRGGRVVSRKDPAP